MKWEIPLGIAVAAITASAYALVTTPERDRAAPTKGVDCEIRIRWNIAAPADARVSYSGVNDRGCHATNRKALDVAVSSLSQVQTAPGDPLPVPKK